jgi:hypothetical protein
MKNLSTQAATGFGDSDPLQLHVSILGMDIAQNYKSGWPALGFNDPIRAVGTRQLTLMRSQVVAAEQPHFAKLLLYAKDEGKILY